VNNEGDAAALTAAGADCLMTDYRAVYMNCFTPNRCVDSAPVCHLLLRIHKQIDASIEKSKQSRYNQNQNRLYEERFRCSHKTSIRIPRFREEASWAEFAFWLVGWALLVYRPHHRQA
jgi:hypothetical protein